MLVAGGGSARPIELDVPVELAGLPDVTPRVAEIEAPPGTSDMIFAEWRRTVATAVRQTFVQPPDVLVGVPDQTEHLLPHLARDIPGTAQVILAKGDPSDPATIDLRPGGRDVMRCLPERVLVVAPDYSVGDMAAEQLLSGIVGAWMEGWGMQERVRERDAQGRARLNLALSPLSPQPSRQLWVGRVSTWASRVDGSESKWLEPHATTTPYARVI